MAYGDIFYTLAYCELSSPQEEPVDCKMEWTAV